ncbi:hypothetical protein CHS0354_005274 [Potamilus streckersoni]|uniref:Uncharacterized protein n=1 Tax=Potamilus streckersoni TaxID=2493646 RepID=A0AAE0S356_9BIVA|nr:hypothetical protein CHS0354_005274 [Potamilus streckersoni]
MENERHFWDRFVAKYLHPLEKDVQAENEMAQKLVELRNNIALGMVIVNLLWIAINSIFQIGEAAVVELQYKVSS